MSAEDSVRLIRSDTDMSRFGLGLSTSISDAPLAVSWVGRESIFPRDTLEHRRYPFGLLKYVLHGSATFLSGPNLWRLESGMVFWSLPNQQHRIEAGPGDQIACYFIQLVGDEVESVFDRYLHSNVGATQLTEFDPVRALFEQVIVEAKSARDEREENCLSLTRVLLSRIDDLMANPKRPNAIAKRTFERCRLYIDHHFSQVANLAQVAQACGLTVPYLCRLFDQFCDTSPYDYLTRLKMRRAEQILLGQDILISEVAHTVGYSDSRLFARNFKAYFGVSPADYRKRHR